MPESVGQHQNHGGHCGIKTDVLIVWNRPVRSIETSLGCVLCGMRASAHVGKATTHTERPLYLSKLHAKVVKLAPRLGTSTRSFICGPQRTYWVSDTP